MPGPSGRNDTPGRSLASAWSPTAHSARLRPAGTREPCRDGRGYRMSGQAQIVIDKVNHTYRPPRGRPVLALADVSLEVRPREFLAHPRPLGLRKIDAALSGRRLSADRGRPHPGRGQAGHRARPRSRHRVSAFCAVSLEDGARQHPLRSRTAGLAARRARAARTSLHRPGRLARIRGQLSRRSCPAA